jgi:hypothetical protein
VADTGVTLTEVRFPLLTVSEPAPLMLPEDALMVTLPADLPVANPVRLTVAIVPLLVDQFAELVMSRVEPLL